MESAFLDLYFYRFQLTPDRVRFNPELEFDDTYITSIEMLTERKNEIFEKCLEDILNTKKQNQKYAVRKESSAVGLPVYRIAVNRTKKVEIDWQKGRFIDQPSFFMVVDNNPNTQIILLSKNSQAYPDMQSEQNKVQAILSGVLNKYYLKLSISPIYQESEFWNFISKYGDDIRKVKFELQTPNLADVSRHLGEWIKRSMKRSNADKASLEYEAPSNSSLNLEKDDPDISGMAAYASDGAGEVSFKISKRRAFIRLGSTALYMNLSENDILTLKHEDVLIELSMLREKDE